MPRSPLWIAVGLLSVALAGPAAAAEPVKVFVLAGQSNMEGHGFVAADPHEYVYGKDDRVIRCPWHGWEFDLETGRSLLEPKRVGLKTYRVTQEGDEVVLHA